jgi:endonuclease/exonuclease/phosphatase family metal-dependent hydrolase
MKCGIIMLSFSSLVLYFIYKDRSSQAFFKPVKTVKPEYQGVMTYNIQYLPWKTKPLQTLREISRGYPILYLQECYNRFTSLDLSSIFPEYYITRGKLQGVALVNSGLVTLSKFPILSYKLITFKNYRPYTSDTLSEKGFLETVIDINGTKVCCINTHLQSSDHAEFDPIVLDQLQEIQDYLQTVKIPYMIGGDFNIDVNVLHENYMGLSNGLRAASPTSPTIYMNLKSGETSSKPAKGYGAYVFDYFLMHPSILSKQAVCEVNEYSDHNPVYLLFENEKQDESNDNHTLNHNHIK